MRITIKIGSNVLTREDGSLDFTRMSALVDQIATLRQMGHEIILVSSGAVASGRSELKHIQENLDSVDQRQLFSAVGQAKLINRYFELFREYGISVGQVLTTKENFLDAEHLRNQANCMRVMLENRVLPIVNENDTVSITELMFTDNDELSGLIAEMTKSQCLIILSNIDGFYTGNPSESDSRLIRVVNRGCDLSQYIQKTKSSAGRGGMQSKYCVASRLASSGIGVVIANGKRENILLKVMTERDKTPCTEFLC
ncbi:MAG: glutamate 5-kinase [Bacteroidaceae bacterium]|nr:glutamate 5-kinase [Bacteroidaceae bacterium]MBR4528213.1 glutamate 5-kinase [Bacteroidaceae bacterium]